MKLQGKIVSGIGWTSIASFGSQGIRLLFKLILAKLLLPEDYGIIGMAAVFIGFTEVISELGMVSALIQRPKQDLHPIHYSTAFWINVGIALLGYGLIVVLVSPLAARFYEEPILQSIMPLLAIPVVFNTLYAIPKAKLSKNMRFKPQAITEISAALMGGIIACILAFRGWGVWALVWNGVIVSLVSSILYYIQVRWHPTFTFSKYAFKDLFGFGSKVMVERIFHYFTLNIDYLLIGKLIGGAALGAYTLGFILTNTLMKQITNVVNKVMFPAYSSMQNSIKAIARYYLQISKVNQLVVFPCMLVLIVLAKPIIWIFFGQQWALAIVPLQILALGVVLNGLSGNATIVMRSVGRSDLSMKLSIGCTLFSTIPAVTIGALSYGINGAAFGLLLDRLFRFFWYQRVVHKLIGVHYSAVLKLAWKPLIACIVIGASIVLVHQLHSVSYWVQLIVGGVMISTGYLWYLYFFERELLSKVVAITGIRDKVITPMANYITS